MQVHSADHKRTDNRFRASSFWTAAFSESGLAKSRRIIAYDFDGHGLSDFSGRLDLSMEDLVEDLKDVLAALNIPRAILVGHSMNGVRGLHSSIVHAPANDIAFRS